MEDDEITDGIVPVFRPYLDIYSDNFLLVVMDENGVRQEGSFATLQILRTAKIGQQQIGEVFEAGQHMRADYEIEVRVQAFGAKASQRIRNLRMALDFDSVEANLNLAGLGIISADDPVDVDDEKNTLFEHRTVMDVTLSGCMGNFCLTTYDASTDFGKLGRPVFDTDVVPIEEVTVIGDLYPDGNDSDPFQITTNVDVTP